MSDLERAELVIVGAGAAGLMAAIWAGRAGAHPIVLDGARTLGAKILVAGGGRCNVTHDEVDERSYSGSSRNSIRNVLRRFTVPETIEFFASLGVRLKREDTGKLFPVTDSARTVLEALLRATYDAGAEIRHPRRVEQIERSEDGEYVVRGPWGALRTPRVIMATGGRSLPRSGSDGAGFTFAESLGHTATRQFPALVALTVADGWFGRELSGLATDVEIEVRSGTGKRLASIAGAVLCTHFGLSGPCAMDISRHWQDARADDAGTQLVVRWVPGISSEQLDAELQQLGTQPVGRYLGARVPTRMARALCEQAGIDAAATGQALRREERRALLRAVLDTPVPVTGTRGWSNAEATAGGVPLNEVRLETMESRVAPGLHLCGEVLDVDGRIGGYNFQWAWSSGFVAGQGAAKALLG